MVTGVLSLPSRVDPPAHPACSQVLCIAGITNIAAANRRYARDPNRPRCRGPTPWLWLLPVAR
ncbi:hypothetical protein GCM10010172_43890 [Paractinoplanes ferrugineus]|uniref:Uncharacterized protein n=1 Tax=Paractinoplanes ferrugineus TaxID=113564 RepID=A0A919MMS1_9ACTN|nr:hypothetical protein Afe05nite_53870 [Actinoplanes ferrugineus]